MVHEHFVCDTYKCNVLFYSGCKFNEVMEHLQSEYNIELTEDWSDCKGVRFREVATDGHIYYGIWLKKTKDYGTFVHELLHLVYAIFTDREIKVTVGNQETVAYYMAYWFEKIRPYFTARKKNINGRK